MSQWHLSLFPVFSLSTLLITPKSLQTAYCYSLGSADISDAWVKTFLTIVSIYPTPPIYRCSLLVFRVLYEGFSEEKPHYSIPVWCHFFTNNTKYLLNPHCQFTSNHICGTTASHWWSTWITIMKQVNHNCGHSKLNVY